MKKLLFAAHDMDIGGIETSLVTLLNYLVEQDYDITLVLEQKEGIFLSQLDSKIRVIEYRPNASKNIVYRKMVNMMKRIRFILKYKNKFDFSASYATYSLMSAFVTRCASSNNALWGHADYWELFNKDEVAFKTFFEKLEYANFKHIVFVSKAACQSFLAIYPDMQGKVLYCNNLINADKIVNLAKESVDFAKENIYTFVNVGRHDEHQKKLTRIIEASKKLTEEGFKFQVLCIGQGPDTKKYQELVNRYQLQDKIKFLGAKQNPYPYMQLADCVILSSEYEGYPVVFLESFVLHKPIITTEVSDALEQVQDKYGKVVSKDTMAIYEAMKEGIQQGFSIKEEFNANQYNDEMIHKLKQIF